MAGGNDLKMKAVGRRRNESKTACPIVALIRKDAADTLDDQ